MRSSGLLVALVLAGCSSIEGARAEDPDSGVAGAVGTGGAGGTANTGGTSGTGGATKTGGSGGSGGTANTGGAFGTGGMPEPAGQCDSLGSVGQWTSIAPASVLPGRSPDCLFGIPTPPVVDPQVPGVVYFGTCGYGIWKSRDCGSTWEKVNTGTLGSRLDAGRQWNLVIDPVNPQTLYTNDGYEPMGHSGAYRSDDGGVNWKEVWPPPDGTYSTLVPYNFVAQVYLDPTNNQHVFVSFHQICNPDSSGAAGKGTYKDLNGKTVTSICYAESRDQGEHWVVHSADPRWGYAEAQNIFILGDKNWLFADNDSIGAMWITTDGGASWSEIAPGTAGHWPPQPYHSTDGHWYIGTDTGLLRSADGAKWSLVPDFPGHSYVNATLGNGETMWASDFGTLQAFNPKGVGNPYYQSAENDGLTWVPAPFTDPPGLVRTQGAVAFAYDRAYNVLYTTNGTQGAWRVVVR